MKVYIVGCAKTGTWLTLRLFHAFADFELVASDREYTLPEICNAPEGRRDGHAVWKRDSKAIFSNEFPLLPPARHQMKWIRRHRVRVVYVQRNRAATLASDNGYVSPERYRSCVAQAKRFRSYIRFTVDYDALLRDPDKVQQGLAASLGLQIVHPWSAYPDFVPDEAFAFESSRYSRRRIGESY